MSAGDRPSAQQAPSRPRSSPAELATPVVRRSVTPAGGRAAVGTAALVVAALLFGSTFLVVKSAVERAAPIPFLAVRFAIASLALVPVAHLRPATAGEWLDGGLAGLALFGGYVLQTVGLQRIDSSSSAFLTYLLVVIVPVLEALLLRSRPRWTTVAGVATAVVGLVLLTGGRSAGGFGAGDAETLACALCFAAHIVIVGRVTRRHDPVRFTLVQLAVVAALCGLATPVAGGLRGFDLGVLAAAGFTGVFATALAFGLMVAGQRVVSPSRAAILLLIEPASAGVFGVAAGERLGARGLAGALVILAAIVVSEVVPLRLRPRTKPGPAVADGADPADRADRADWADGVDRADGADWTGR